MADELGSNFGSSATSAGTPRDFTTDASMDLDGTDLCACDAALEDDDGAIPAHLVAVAPVVEGSADGTATRTSRCRDTDLGDLGMGATCARAFGRYASSVGARHDGARAAVERSEHHTPLFDGGGVDC